MLAPHRLPEIACNPSGLLRKFLPWSASMVKRGSVCNHPSRPEIDRGLMAAVPYRALAGQLDLSPLALCCHAQPLASLLTLSPLLPPVV